MRPTAEGFPLPSPQTLTVFSLQAQAAGQAYLGGLGLLGGVDTHGETSTVTKNGLSPSIGSLEHVLSKEGHCICLNIHIVFVLFSFFF